MIIWYVLICFAIKVKFADIARETGLDVFYLDVYPFAWVGSSIFVDNGRKRSSLPTLKLRNWSLAIRPNLHPTRPMSGPLSDLAQLFQ